MAGNYPDVPGHRMAYDRDGSQLVRTHVETGTAVALNTISTMNAEGGPITLLSGTNPPEVGVHRATIIFPELRDVVGVWHAGNVTQNTGSFSYDGLFWSTNTTNGVDGTWVAVTAANGAQSSKTSMRSDIRSVNLLGAKAVAFQFTTSDTGSRVADIQAHLYGSPASGQAANKLRFWHPTLDQELAGAYFDWGDTPRNAVLTKTFRVKNPSASLTANNVTLTTEALTDTTPTLPGQHTYSIGGGAYSTSLNIGNLTPGTISGVITVKRQVPSDAALSLWWARIVASAASWT